MSDNLGEIRLLTAIFEAQAPPCEVHNCCFTRLCGDEKLACETFAKYVRTGKAEVPTGLPAIYKYKLIHQEAT